MKKTFLVSLLLVLSLALVSGAWAKTAAAKTKAPSQAATVKSKAKASHVETSSTSSGGTSLYHKFGVYGNLGGSTYFMTAVNETINDANRNASTKTPNIYGGFNLNWGLQYGITERLMLGLDMTYLFANSSRKGTERVLVGVDPYTGDQIFQDATYESTMDLPAFTIGPTLKYAMPLSHKLLLSFGGGLDYVSVFGVSTAKTTVGSNTQSADNKATGSGFGLRLLAGGEYFLTPAFSLGADLGFRLAYVGQLNDKDGKKITYVHDGTTKDYSAEYTGVYLLAGARFYF